MSDFHKLNEPFPEELVEKRPVIVFEAAPGCVKAKYLHFVDARHYQERLDQVFGQAQWFCRYEQLGSGSIISCHLIKRDGSTETLLANDICEVRNNDWRSAATSAFTRACTALGIGRELYLNKNEFWGTTNADNTITPIDHELIWPKTSQDRQAWQNAVKKFLFLYQDKAGEFGNHFEQVRQWLLDNHKEVIETIKSGVSEKLYEYIQSGIRGDKKEEFWVVTNEKVGA